MNKPLIGITLEAKPDAQSSRYDGVLELPWNYPERVAAAGGNPILIPPSADIPAIAKLIDGWLIPGGRDIDAAYFGQENHPEVSLGDPMRYECERALYHAVDPNMPIFGICYGCQFLNVVRGGDLIQHLPDVVPTLHTGGSLQTYDVDKASALATLAGKTQIEGKSYHHQAIGTVGNGLRVVAHSEDGVIEAVEATDRPFQFGVQWHPERTPEDVATQNMFRSFIDAARAYAAGKAGS